MEPLLFFFIFTLQIRKGISVYSLIKIHSHNPMTIIQLRRQALLLVFLLNIFCTTYAQVSVFAPTISVNPASSISIPIKVDSFNRIVTTQFTIEWNPQVLSFNNLEQFGLELTEQDNFDVKPELGMMSFLWFDKSAMVVGVDLPDSTTIFALNFDVIGAEGTSSPIEFTNSITPQEVADTSFNPINATFINGDVKIGGDGSTTNTDFESLTPNVKIFPSFPNPFTENTRIIIESKVSSNVQVKIYDLYGKETHHQLLSLRPGQTNVNLEAKYFEMPGVYFIVISNDTFSAQQVLIRQ